MIIPYPVQGHINPMLQFGKRLASKGLKVTLVNTRFVTKSMDINPLNNIILLETISDGFDEGGSTVADSPESYLSTFKSVGSESLSKLLQKLQDSGNPVNAIVYDGFWPWALDVAKKFGLIGVTFFTQSCAVSNLYYHVYKGVVTVPVTGSIDSVAGLPLLQVSDIPSFASGNCKKYPAFYNVVVNQFSNVDRADWVLHTSFLEMEEQVLNHMPKSWKLRTIGPTIPSMYLDKTIENDANYGLNLFKPSFPGCIDWLNNKPKASVVYISFGSLAVLKTEQMEELAYGLKARYHHFLWVVRESEQPKHKINFKQEVTEKGLVVTWCQQLDVLANVAIGCFVTHCGFNSVMESC